MYFSFSLIKYNSTFLSYFHLTIQQKLNKYFSQQLSPFHYSISLIFLQKSKRKSDLIITNHTLHLVRWTCCILMKITVLLGKLHKFHLKFSVCKNLFPIGPNYTFTDFLLCEYITHTFCFQLKWKNCWGYLLIHMILYTVLMITSTKLLEMKISIATNRGCIAARIILCPRVA